VDWGYIVGTVVGAAISSAGVFYSQWDAKRQAARSRELMLSDAERARREAREDDERRVKEARAHRAAEEILAIFAARFSLIEDSADTERDREDADIFVRTLYQNAAFIPDPEIRDRVNNAASILDYSKHIEAKTGDGLRWIVYRVRILMHETLGSWLTGADIPPVSDAIVRLTHALEEVKSERREAFLGRRASGTS
jgi:hypothetical protein